jgi:hypothetical protein
MSNGHVFVAQNSTVDYVRQAYALALSIKKHNKLYKDTCLVTNHAVPEEYKHAFDHIVPIPWGDDAEGSAWKIENRWKVIHASPFDESIVYDTDMLLLNSNDHWWKYLEQKDLFFTSTVTDYRGGIINNDFYRKTFTANNLVNVYTGAFYFKKIDRTYEFFKWLEIIVDQWRKIYPAHLKKSPQTFCSMDVSSALALKFMGCEEDFVTTGTLVPSFTHMKPAIQRWKNVPAKWTSTVNYYFDDAGNLKVGNFQQHGLFHYVEEEFLTDDIIKKLEML